MELQKTQQKDAIFGELSKFETRFKDWQKAIDEQLRNFRDAETRFTKLLNKSEIKMKEDVNIFNKRSESRYLSLEEKISQSIEEVNEKIKELDIERQKMARRMTVNTSEQGRRMSILSPGGHGASRQSSVILQIPAKKREFRRMGADRCSISERHL